MTVTVTIRGGEAREKSNWLRQRFASLVERLNNVVYGPRLCEKSHGCYDFFLNRQAGATDVRLCGRD